MEIKDKLYFFLILIIIIFFISGIIKFILNYCHLLINLVRLEFIILRLFLLSFIYFLGIKFELIFMIVFLTLIVSEGVLGLSLLISIVRIFGNNYFQVINLFK